MRTNLLLLFGLLAAPLAWASQLVVGWGIGEARCSVAGMEWGLDSQAGTAALLGATGAIALAGLGVSAWLQRSAARDERGRVAFMAGGGILVSAVFVALILLGGVGALFVEHCRGS
jgi:hypothetical protein